MQTLSTQRFKDWEGHQAGSSTSGLYEYKELQVGSVSLCVGILLYIKLSIGILKKTENVKHVNQTQQNHASTAAILYTITVAYYRFSSWISRAFKMETHEM